MLQFKMEQRKELQNHLLKIEELFTQIETENERLACMKEYYNKLIADKQSKIEYLCKENEDLKSQVSSNRDKFVAYDEKIGKLETTIRLNQKKFLDKSAQLQVIINTYQKNCRCDVSKRINEQSQDQVKEINEERENISRLLSPDNNPSIKPKSDVKELAPMTEQYSGYEEEFDTDIPIIGETEYPLPQSDNEMDTITDTEDESNFMESPSVLGHFPETPGMVEPFKIPGHHETKSPNVNNIFETSAELFNDSPKTSAKEFIKNKKIHNRAKTWIDTSIQKSNSQSLASDSNASKKLKTKHLKSDSTNKNITNNTKSKKSQNKKVYDMNNDSFFNSPTKPVKPAIETEIKNNKAQLFSTPKPLPINEPVNKPNTPSPTTTDKDESLDNLDDTAFFDKLLKKNERKPEYKATKVIRGKSNREKLDGFACHECRKYYASDNLTDKQMQDILNYCSKHRHDAPPAPDTPDEFWAVDFPKTQEYMKKGYLVQDENGTNQNNNRTAKGQKRRLKYQ